MLCASITAQEAALEALRSGKKDMLAMKADYRDRRNVIVKRLNEMGLKCFLPEGAFYVFPNITSSGLSSRDFATQLLMKKKVAVVPGTGIRRMRRRICALLLCDFHGRNQRSNG